VVVGVLCLALLGLGAVFFYKRMNKVVTLDSAQDNGFNMSNSDVKNGHAPNGTEVSIALKIVNNTHF
jgi:hypothetical protein